ESARKVIHVLAAAAAISLWLLFGRRDTALVVGTFVIVLALVRRFLRQEVRSLYGVRRTSYGEMFFPAGVSAAALATSSQTQFISAMLILGLADTAAALVGTHWPIGHYQLGRGSKTLSGSLAFAAVAAAISLAA